MTLEMVDREVRFAKADGETFRNGGADHQRTGEAGSAGCGKRVDLRHLDLSLARYQLEESGRVHQMITRSDFGNNAAIFSVFRYLRRDFAGQQLRAGVAVASAQDRDRGFVARSFKSQDCFHCLSSRAQARDLTHDAKFTQSIECDPTAFARSLTFVRDDTLRKLRACRKS